MYSVSVRSFFPRIGDNLTSRYADLLNFAATRVRFNSNCMSVNVFHRVAPVTQMLVTNEHNCRAPQGVDGDHPPPPSCSRKAGCFDSQPDRRWTFIRDIGDIGHLPIWVSDICYLTLRESVFRGGVKHHGFTAPPPSRSLPAPAGHSTPHRYSSAPPASGRPPSHGHRDRTGRARPSPARTRGNRVPRGAAL